MMKRLLLTLLTAFFLTPGFAQIPSALHFEKFRWESIEYDYATEYKQMEVNQLFRNGEVQRLYASAYLRTEDFHLLDYDEDGYMDLVYDGFLEDENCRHTLFFRGYCEDWCGYYKLDGDFYGEVVGLWRYKEGDPISFRILDRPLCEGITTHVETYEVVDKKDQAGFRLVSKEAYILWTDFPEVFTMNAPFQVEQDYYRLRFAPAFDDTSQVELDAEEYVEGNVIAEYGEGSTGVALASKVGEDGTLWWFVRMDNLLLPESSLFQDGNNPPAPTKYYGWMSSRHLTLSLEQFN